MSMKSPRLMKLKGKIAQRVSLGFLSEVFETGETSPTCRHRPAAHVPTGVGGPATHSRLLLRYERLFIKKIYMHSKGSYIILSWLSACLSVNRKIALRKWCGQVSVLHLASVVGF